MRAQSHLSSWSVVKVTRNTLIERHAPQEAAALQAIKEQQEFAAQYRDTLLQSVGDMVDFAKADELIAAATDELAA